MNMWGIPCHLLCWQLSQVHLGGLSPNRRGFAPQPTTDSHGQRGERNPDEGAHRGTRSSRQQGGRELQGCQSVNTQARAWTPVHISILPLQPDWKEWETGAFVYKGRVNFWNDVISFCPQAKGHLIILEGTLQIEYGFPYAKVWAQKSGQSPCSPGADIPEDTKVQR